MATTMGGMMGRDSTCSYKVHRETENVKEDLKKSLHLKSNY